jgi:hypothetical protein
MVEGSMNKKKTAEPAASMKTTGQHQRSKSRLALLALAPLLLAGAAYGTWAIYAEDANAEAVEIVVPPEIAAESSFTHSFALSVLITPNCGKAYVPALRAASDAEVIEDGDLANLSWLAAARRVSATTARSCDYLRQEVRAAELRAEKLMQEKGNKGH